MKAGERTVGHPGRRSRARRWRFYARGAGSGSGMRPRDVQHGTRGSHWSRPWRRMNAQDNTSTVDVMPAAIELADGGILRWLSSLGRVTQIVMEMPMWPKMADRWLSGAIGSRSMHLKRQGGARCLDPMQGATLEGGIVWTLSSRLGVHGEIHYCPFSDRFPTASWTVSE